MDPGRAAESGLLSALIAREGVRGIATDPIEGRFGFLETHAGPRNYDASTITRGLSQRWEISDVFRKRYPTSYVCTYVLDAALRVRKRLERDLARVEEVRFGEKASNLELFCEPERQKRRPGSIYDAETSFYFLVALALSEGSVDIRGLDRFEDGALLRLGDRVNGVVDEESHWIEVEFDDGTVEREVQNSLDPTTEEQTRRKFFENSQPVIGREGANKLEGMVNSLEELKDVGRLAEVMRREVGS
jgi:2-methylcitrate dehydratase PrpD